MSATDELRSLLERRGIEWEAPRSAMADMRTIWSDGVWDMQADEDAGGWFDVEAFRYARSPQEAAESPSCCGTCSIVKTWSDSDYDEDWRYRCSECGAFIGVYERVPETGCPVDYDNYCPNCGREVVEG